MIVDAFALPDMQTGDDGMAHAYLLAPDDKARGDINAFTPIREGYFLAGWYQERVEAGTDEKGNPAYTYAKPWDFEKDTVTVDPAGKYSASEPVMTLYAAWIPMFELQLFDLETGEDMDTVFYDPTSGKDLFLPDWDRETGAIKMNGFPEKSGYTFAGAYYDSNGIELAEGPTIVHPGTVNYEQGVAENTVMKLYVDWIEGEWYHIYTAEQFVENATVTGSYVIHEDLDFSEETWPTELMHGGFEGTIQGNGHTFKNITFAQTNNSKEYSGLFGQLKESAIITDLDFENVTFTIEGGTRKAGACFGLLAGYVSPEARLMEITITDSKLLIDSDCYFGTDEYSIGLVCGGGTVELNEVDIWCEATGEDPKTVKITVETDNSVTVKFGVAPTEPESTTAPTEGEGTKPTEPGNTDPTGNDGSTVPTETVAD